MNSWTRLLAGPALTVVAAFVGTFTAGLFQFQQWQLDKEYKTNAETIAARREIVTRVSDIFIDGTMLAIRRAAKPNDNKNPVSRTLYCLEEANRQAPDCQDRSGGVFNNEFVTEFLPMHQRFMRVSVAVRLHFCAPSILAFERLPKGYWWWNASEATKRDIIAQLEADLYCPINTRRP
jgi:hypothetical protein